MGTTSIHDRADRLAPMRRRKPIFAEGRRVLAHSKWHPEESFAVVTKNHYTDDYWVAVKYEDNGLSTTFAYARPISRPADMQRAQFLGELAEAANEDSTSPNNAELIRHAVACLAGAEPLE